MFDLVIEGRLCPTGQKPVERQEAADAGPTAVRANGQANFRDDAEGPDVDGIPYVDDRGHHADFHALRKTFITNLSRAGVFPKTDQLTARHSDINLTMKRLHDARRM